MSADLTLAEIMGLVDRKLENYSATVIDDAVGDGEQAVFRLSHEGIDADTMVCTVDDVANTDYALNADLGLFEFDSAPADAGVIYWYYEARHWAADDVQQAVNDAVLDLFPAFYVTELDTTLSTASGTYEYELTGPIEAVSGVEWRSTSTSPWMRLKRYRYGVTRDGTDIYIQFHDNPPAGSVRARLIKRPIEFTASDDTLDDIGLPAEAAKPIVLYACWDLLNQKFAKRVRTDEAVAVQGEGVAPPDQFQRAIAAFRYAYEAALAKNRMAPWSTR